MSDVCGLTFTLTPDAGRAQADLRFQNATAIKFNDHGPNHVNAGFITALPDYSTDVSDYGRTVGFSGDSWFKSNDYFHNAPVGSTAYRTALEAVVSAVGLRAPASGSSDLSVLEGAPTSIATAADNPQSLMQDDIAALQWLYGANYRTNSGNTTYSFDPTTGQMFVEGVGQELPTHNFIYRTIWDGGGTDTYDLSNYTTNLSIDLNPGAWSTFDTNQLADLGGGMLARGNLANARLDPRVVNSGQTETTSLIENAIGGSGNDTIVGNAAANTLTGGAGDDYLVAGVGFFADTLIGGAGDDQYYVKNAGSILTLVGPGGTDTIQLPGDAVVENANEGNDTVLAAFSYTLTDNVESLVLMGTDALNGTGNGLDNEIYGNTAVNTLSGGAGNDTIDGRAGGDTMIGGSRRHLRRRHPGTGPHRRGRQRHLRARRQRRRSRRRGIRHRRVVGQLSPPNERGEALPDRNGRHQRNRQRPRQCDPRQCRRQYADGWSRQ